jgi:hypothetical protein
VIDGETVLTGSSNFTKAAEEHNAENLFVSGSLERTPERLRSPLTADCPQGLPIRPRASEADENTQRKALSPDEAVAIGTEIEKAFKPLAEEKERKAGGDKKSDTVKSLGGNSPKRSRDESARTTAMAAELAAAWAAWCGPATTAADEAHPAESRLWARG